MTDWNALLQSCLQDAPPARRPLELGEISYPDTPNWWETIDPLPMDSPMYKQTYIDAPPKPATAHSVSWRLFLALIVPPLAIIAAGWMYADGLRIFPP